MTKSITKTLLHLLKDFKSTEHVTEIDFIRKCIDENRFSSEDVIIDYFLKLAQCEEFLKKIVKDFIAHQKLFQVNEEYIKVLIFFLIFLLDSKNANEILEDPVSYTIPLLNYLCLEEKYPLIAKWASNYFDNEFIVHVILEPLLGRSGAFKAIIKYIEQDKEKGLFINKTTIPKPFKLTSTLPSAPVNTPNVGKSEKETLSPHEKHYLSFDLIQKKLKQQRQKHVSKAKLLLDKAKKSTTTSVNKTVPTKKIEEPKPTAKFTARKLPPKKDVDIKKNLATTLREAALILKEQEEEVSRIENILKGGYSSVQIETALIEERKDNEKKAWQDIQRKHLEGLITFEESIIAKKKLLAENRAKFLEMQEEKIDMLRKLDEYKEKQQEKLKAQVEKTHKEKEEAREAEKKFLEKKLVEARLRDYELQAMLRKREEEKAAELAAKMELIQELKNIHEITMKMNQAKREFDPTETSNLGLLCEMSIAELRERLSIEKLKMTQELEEKRQRVLTKKRQQQEMLEKYRDFIESTRRTPKMVIEPVYRPPALEEDEGIRILRKELEEKRRLRIKM